MRSKILIIIAFLAIVTGAFYSGHSIARKQARQACIDAVNENCEYICGVSADFYFPDKYDRYDSEDPDDSAIAFYRN
jgi:hypothetical protein